MTRHFVAAAIALAATTLPAGADPAKIAAGLAEAEAMCQSVNGTFSAGEAVVSVDLDGDGQPDTVLDEARYACSTAASLYGGSGGALVRFFVGGTETARLARGWGVVDWSGRPVVLLSLHGAECGGIGADSCYEAIVFENGRARTLRR